LDSIRTWSFATVATQGLLRPHQAAFVGEQHQMTGKPSPEFGVFPRAASRSHLELFLEGLSLIVQPAMESLHATFMCIDASPFSSPSCAPSTVKGSFVRHFQTPEKKESTAATGGMPIRCSAEAAGVASPAAGGCGASLHHPFLVSITGLPELEGRVIACALLGLAY
jgi:hypothetical protein